MKFPNSQSKKDIKKKTPGNKIQPEELTVSKDASNIVFPMLKNQKLNQNVGIYNQKEEKSPKFKKFKYDDGKIFTQKNFKFKGENSELKKNIGENSYDNLYKEDEIMTNFDGYWILRRNFEHMKKLSEDTKKQIIADRKRGDESIELTPEEEQMYKKKMKSSKKFQTKMLKKEVKLRNKCSLGIKGKKPGKYLNIEFKNNEDLVKFGGYFIKKEAAEQIQKLCDSMRAKGCPEDKIALFQKLEIRKEERKMKRELKAKPSTTQYEIASVQHSQISKNFFTCFRCNSVDHLARNCPLNKKNSAAESDSMRGNKCSEVGCSSKNCFYSSQTSDESNVLKCYKCNEVGHFSRSCPKNSKTSEESNIVKCYKCNEIGHFSKSCPKSFTSSDVSNIVKCYKCNEVGHFSKNCPNSPQSNNKSDNVKCYKSNKIGQISKSCPEVFKTSEESNIVKCYKCNEVGHFSKNCSKTSSKTGEESNIVKCYKCNEVGHFAKSCSKNSKTFEESNIVKCYKCNEVGHFSKYCSKNV